MIGLLLSLGEDAGWLALCMLATGLIIAVLAGVWELACRAARVRVARELRELDEPLPEHAPGRLRASRRVRRQLHRDLVLLLVLNAHRADEDA